MTDLISVPWRRTFSGDGPAGTTLRAQVQGEPHGLDPVIGEAGTPEVAAEACDSHNAMLDLLWLTEAGFSVELTAVWPFRRQRSWRASLSPAPDGWTATCGQGGSPGEALARAREWAETKRTGS